eukprot:2143044-Alexandrium_andersonii.AAC.1
MQLVAPPARRMQHLRLWSHSFGNCVVCAPCSCWLRDAWFWIPSGGSTGKDVTANGQPPAARRCTVVCAPFHTVLH